MVTPLYPTSHPWVSRRALGFGALSGVALLTAGCTTAGDRDGDRQGPSDRPTERAAPSAEGADRGLVVAALRAEQALVDRIRGARRRHPSLGGGAVGTAWAIHRAHVALLSPAADTLGSRDRDDDVPAGELRTARAALEGLVRAERRLRADHAEAAMAATSGSFARLLAGLAAAAAQQERVLSQLEVRGRRRT